MILTTPSMMLLPLGILLAWYGHTVKLRASSDIHCMKGDSVLKPPFPSPTAIYTAAHCCLSGLNLNSTSSKKPSLTNSSK